MRRFTVLVGAALVAPLLVACGDDGELTRAEYTSRANTICTRVMNDTNRVFEGGFPVVKSQVPAFIDELAPIITRGMDDLQELQGPENARVDRVEREAGRLGARWEDARTDDAEAQRVFQEEGGFEGFQRASEAYNLTACANLGEEEQAEEGERTLDPATFSSEKRAYVERVDAICRQYNERFEQLEQDVFGEDFPPPIEKWAQGLPRLVAVGREQLAQIKQVRPPDSDQAFINELSIENERLLADLEEAGRVAAAGNERELGEKLPSVFERFDEFDGRLRSYGFQVCGSEEDEGEEQE
jgi:hypothetical protein